VNDDNNINDDSVKGMMIKTKRKDNSSLTKNNRNHHYYNNNLPSVYSLKDEQLLSTIGPIMWNSKFDIYFKDNNYYRKQQNNNLLVTNSNNINVINVKNKVDYDHFDININQNLGKRRANNYTDSGRPTANHLYNELSNNNNNSSSSGISSNSNNNNQNMMNSSLDGHVLISPYRYGEVRGPGEYLKQPYSIHIHPQVGIICDIHSHLCNAEIIGLLAGMWDFLLLLLYLSIFLSAISIFLSTYLSIHLSIYQSYLSIHRSFYPSYLSIYFIYPSINPSTCLLYISIYLSIDLSIHHIYLST
jgi:hypothetical protein